jgi:hypothetical protein
VRELSPEELDAVSGGVFVYDADGSIGVVMEFSERDFEAYSMPDLALVGAFQTKAQAAQAFGARMHPFRH